MAELSAENVIELYIITLMGLMQELHENGFHAVPGPH